MPGLFFEDFEVGKVYDHPTARSVTDFDNIWYSCMTLNTQPLHLNFDFSAREGLQQKPLFNSMYTLSIVIGQSTTELTRGTLVALVGLDDIQFPRSVFAGDTLYSRSTVLAVENAADTAGKVELLHEGFNQARELVATCRRSVLVRKRAARQGA